jgi:prepilin-type N-terminal cleavage/methylation domain-containing protein
MKEKFMNRNQKGFTLLEMLVSVAIFSLMMIAVYYFFDSGRWMYLKSEKKANLQENGRVAMEAMEREMRMIAFGLPTGTQIGTEITWMPAIFNAERSEIGFRGDIDNENSLPTANIASADTTISVQWPEWVCPSNNTPIVLVERGRNWLSRTCGSRTATTITLSSAAGHDFMSAETEIFSLAHVFYRVTPDTDSDGVCDLTENFEQCKIERAKRVNLLPQTAVESESDWKTFATNIRQFRLEYYRKTTDVLELTSLPLGAGDRSLVDLIRIELIATDRSDKVQEYQDSEFVSEILVRKRKF